MGAGRRTETVNYNNGQSQVIGGNNLKPLPQRKLAERGRLGSVIFGCTPATYNECVTNKLFGLPYVHHTYVEHIVPGMPLFLFNYFDRKMHGIFEAVSEGALDISPYAWTSADARSNTPFRAQVRVQLRRDFARIVSLPENVFKETLIDSYYAPNHLFFEVDTEQTERLIRLFERAAGNSYRTVVPKNPATSAWQTVSTPSKVWKPTNDNVDTDDKLKSKKPATIVMSAWEPGAQYIPSSSKELVEEEVGSHQQQAGWDRRFSPGDDSFSDGSEDLQTSYKAAEVKSEADMRRSLSNEKAEQDHGLQTKSANGYRPKLNGTSAVRLATEGGRTNGTDGKQLLTEKQVEDYGRALGRLKVIDTQSQQTAMHHVQHQTDGEVVLKNANHGTAEWERLARDRSAQEQVLLREEREKLGTTLSDLDSAIAMTVKKNLELYAMAIAQMRQDGMELRRLLDEARMRPEEMERLAAVEKSNVFMADEIQALKLEVTDLRRQLCKSVTQDKSERLQGAASSQMTAVESFDPQTPPSIFLIGGLGDQLSRLESVMVWSPVTDRLKTAAPMLTPRCCAGASVLDGHIYVFGGGDGTLWYDTVERYDRRDDQWRSCAPMKTKRGSLGGVTVGDRIFAVGGGNGQVSFSEVESYDPYLGAWFPCTSMFEKRFCVAATEFGGALYALGGFDGEQYLMSVERFDPREALWSKMPSMSVKRGSLSAGVLNGKIYALGGYDGDSILDVVEIFDPRAGRWDMALQMCCQRAYGAVAVVGETLYYMGGLAEDEAVDSELRSPDIMNGIHEDDADPDGEDGGYRSWRSQWQASWQQYVLGISVPGLNISSSYQIQRFTEATGWQSMRPRVIGKRSCLAAVVF